MSIYKYSYIYKNTDIIDTVKIYKNGKESYFVSCNVGDEEILKWFWKVWYSEAIYNITKEMQRIPYEKNR